MKGKLDVDSQIDRQDCRYFGTSIGVEEMKKEEKGHSYSQNVCNLKDSPEKQIVLCKLRNLGSIRRLEGGVTALKRQYARKRKDRTACLSNDTTALRTASRRIIGTAASSVSQKAYSTMIRSQSKRSKAFTNN